MNFYSKIIILTTFILCFSSCIGVFEENPNSDFIPPELHIDDVVIDKGTRILTLRCYYLHSGSNSAPTEMGFYYSENADLSSDQREVSVIKNNYCEAHIIPVRYGKPFYYCAYASNGKNEIRSSVNFIDIPDFEYYVTLGKPNVVPTSGTDVTITSEINKADGVTLSESGVVVTDSDGHDTWVKSNEIGIINVQIKGLTTGAKYYVRSYVKDRDYIAFSEYAQFVPHTVPSLTTANMSDISYTKAISGGITISDNGLEITSKGVVYSTKPNPTIYNSLKTNNGAGTEDYVANISGLSPGTKYYLRAYAVNSDGVGYGNEITFETLSQTNAKVTTTNLSEVTSSSAVSGGNITSDGGSAVTARGVVWSKDHNPTISLSTKTTNGTGTGSYISSISGLEPGATYYVRAYATNANGTSYGEELSFTTEIDLPTVQTNAISSISSKTACSGGKVISNGGAPISAYGIVWSTSPNPTVELSSKTKEASSCNAFSSTMINLKPNTKYYVMAYATNSKGTAYGNELSFTTKAEGSNEGVGNEDFEW